MVKNKTSPKPSNPALYAKIKREAKRKFNVWPSAYASGWLVKEYKRRGGKYLGTKPSTSYGLNRWFEEEWINVCKLPKRVPCGRPKTSLDKWKKKYPYCRPSKRITDSTPATTSELSNSELKKRCTRKRKSPMKRVLVGTGSLRKSTRKKKKSRKSTKKKSRKSTKKKPRKSTKKKPRKSTKKKPRKSAKKPRKSAKKKPRKSTKKKKKSRK